jgi:hypothetical protein
MKQTAVEWLYQELIKTWYDAKSSKDILEQALAMEKEQMFELWNGGMDCTEEGGKSFDQYYNETYNE